MSCILKSQVSVGRSDIDVCAFLKREPSSLWFKPTLRGLWLHLLTSLSSSQQMWYDNSIRRDAKYWDKPVVTLKKNRRPICSSLFLCYSHNYRRLQANHFHMDSMKTLQSLPQYTMRWLCLDLNQQSEEEGRWRKGRRPEEREVGGKGRDWRIGGDIF